MLLLLVARICDIMHPREGKKLPIDTDEVFKQLKKHHGEQVAKDVRDAHLDDIPNIVHILEFAGKNPFEMELFGEHTF